MGVATNPYRPGPAAVPPYLAGRDTLREQIEVNVSSHGNGIGSFLVIHGASGLGKTAILAHMADRARARGWDVIRLEAARGRPLLRPFLQELWEINGLPKRLGGELRSLIERTDLEVRPKMATVRRSASPGLPIRDELLAAVLDVIGNRTDRGGGVLLTVDEAQVINPAERAPLGALVSAVSKASQLTASVAFAGSPALCDQVQDASTCSAGWLFCPLGHLSEMESRAALAIPARDAGRPFTAAALDIAAPATKGHPYAVQLMGLHAWNVAAGAEITPSAAAEANRRMHEALAGEMHRRRWEAAPPYSRRYLAAAAHLGAETGRADAGAIVSLLGVDHSAVSTARAFLIEAGTLIAPGRGRIEEGVPGLFAYIDSQPDAAATIAPRRAARGRS